MTHDGLDAVLLHGEARADCKAFVPRSALVLVKHDCLTDGHYLCTGCERMSGRKIGEYLAENPHIRRLVKAASARARGAS